MAETKNDSGVPPEEQAPRRRWLKIALMVCGGGLLLLGLAVVAFLLIFTDARIRRIIESQASERLEREVTIGSLEVDFRSGIRATDVRIGERAGFESDGLARVDMLDLRVRVWPAVVSLGGRIHARVEIERPEITIVRNVDGELNIGDLIEMLAEERDPLDALSLDLRITDGTLNLDDRAGPEPRRTVLTELNATVALPSYDDPLTYEVAGRAGEGHFRLAGSPTLYHEREVQPEKIDGDVLEATATDLPIPLANLPPEWKTVGGTLAVTAENGSITAVGQFRAATVWPDIAPAAGLDLTVNLARQDIAAAATLAAEPFGSGELAVDIADGGRERMNAGLEFNSDLARLTGSRAAPDLGLPTINGEPATSQGDISGRLALAGSLNEITATLKFDVTGFQPHPALTGDRALPPEDVAVDGELVLGLTADRTPNSLRIVRLAAQSSFLEADVTDGRLTGLSELRTLEADVTGQLAFSGTEFSSRFGRALGLPDLHDRLDASFSAQGTAGRADVSAEAELAREEGPPDPVKLSASARLDAAGEAIDLTDLALAFLAGPEDDRYANLTATGRLTGLPEAPDLLSEFSARTELDRLARRLAAYSAALREWSPAGVVSADGKLEGTPQELAANFRAALAGPALRGTNEASARPLLAAFEDEEFALDGRLTADLTARSVGIERLELASETVTASARGTIRDYVAYRGDLSFSLAARTDLAGPFLRELGMTEHEIDTTGSAELAGRIDTERGRVSLRTVAVDVPYLTVGLDEEAVISGIDIGGFLAEPGTAARSLRPRIALTGAVKLDQIGQLPRDLLPEDLAVSGEVPFTINVRRTSALAMTFTADATPAALGFGNLFAKAAGRSANLETELSLHHDGRAAARLGLALPGGRAEFTGDLSPDRKALAVDRLAVRITDLTELAALSPALEVAAAGGTAALSLSGTVPIAEVAEGKLGGVTITGTAELERLQAALADMPDLLVRLNGTARLQADVLDAPAGFSVALLNVQTERGGTLNLDALRLSPAGDDVPLFGSLDALQLAFEVSAEEIDAGALAAAIPERPEKPEEEPEPLDLAFLKNHAAEGAVRIDRIIYDRHRIEDVEASLSLSENQLTTPAPARAGMYGGSVEAELTADLDEPGIAHRGSVQLADIDMNSASSAAVDIKNVLEGKINGQFSWSGTGFSLIEIASTWSGDGDIAIEDGVVLDLGGHPLFARLFGPVATHLGARAFPDDRYEYGGLELPLRLREGRVGTEDVLITGANDVNFKVERAAVSLTGELDARLGVEAPVDLALGLIRSRVTTNEAALRMIETRMRRDRPSIINFRVGGTAAAPRVTPELAVIDWATAIVRETLTDPRSLLDGLLRPRAPDNAEEDPAEPEADEPEPEPEEDEKDEEPERDPLRDLIEGLFD